MAKQSTEETASTASNCAGVEPLPCAATIGEIRGCYEAMIDGQAAQLSAFAEATCETLDELKENPPPKYTPTAACATIMTECELE